MKLLWKAGLPRGGMAQWALFGVIAVVIGFLAFILAALGLVVGAALAGIFSLFAILASRRRAGGASMRQESGARGEPKGELVELGGDAYTVRIMDEEKTVR